ncbi:hypothetical protein PIB30_086564 [Stylosanthes scabra]|uniref:Uncharacterized protein n=1 Tax=Stylosanthes scabra TaxID=79078 RepID=A0ABU6XTC2_9FABA|nr:hypothetical protein [Stylosanthes scabra]
MVDAQLNNEGADENIPQFTLEKGIIPPNQHIQQLETALRERLERQTCEAEIASEAIKRAEAMAARQQALLEEAEKRDQELKEKLCNRLIYTDEDEGVADSCSCTWKPSVVAGNPPAKENSKHPFSLTILSEELPKKLKYPTDMEPYDGSSDPKHHLDAFDNRMVLLNASVATKCKAFSVTFKKDALTCPLECLKAPYPSRAASERFKRGVTGCNQNTNCVATNPQFRVRLTLEQVLLGVRDSAPGSQEANKLYRIPAVTGSDLLSPGSQALVPCFRGEPRTATKRAVRATPDLDAYASSLYVYAYRTLIYCCEVLDVSFPMAFEPSYLDLCSSSYAQISDKRSGLTALGNFYALIFGCEFLIESLRIRQSVQHESCRY